MNPNDYMNDGNDGQEDPFGHQNDTHFTNKQLAHIESQQRLERAERDSIQKQTPLNINPFDYQKQTRDPNHPHSLIGKLRKRFKPLAMWLSHLHYRMEESSRRRRRIWFGTLIGGIVISAMTGVIWTRGIVVDNTPIGHAKTFINNDEIKPTDEAYDRHNDIARIDLQTSSPSGVVSPSNIHAQFLFAKQPKLRQGMLSPTIQIIPTFDNHFVAVIRHMYPGYQGMKIEFHDKSDVTANTLGNALQNGSNGEPPASNAFTNTHMGATYLPKKTASLFVGKQSSDGNDQGSDGLPNVGEKGQRERIRVADEIQDHDVQNIIVKEKTIDKHPAHIDPHLISTEIANQDIHADIKDKASDIKTKQELIKKQQPLLKQDRDKMRSLNRDVNVSPSNNSRAGDTASQIGNIKNTISNYKSDIAKDNADIKKYRSRWNQINNGIIKMPKPEHQDTALKFRKYHSK